MAIDFIVGDNVIINRAYVEQVLPSVAGTTLQTTVSLGYIGANPSEVLEVGSVVVSPSITLSFIRARPRNTSNPAYQRNAGTIVYFISDTILNNSFELSTSFIDDKQFVMALNSTGSTITKGQFVRQTGFDATQQVPIIALADATTATNSAVLGVASADILTTGLGSIIFTGAFEGLNTSGFASVGAKVFLSNTPGAIATSAGTVDTIVGRALSLDATSGSISLVQSLGGGGGGGGGGAGFFADGDGLNAGIGKGTVPPTTASYGDNALVQGDYCVAGIDSFAQGYKNKAPQGESGRLIRCFAQGSNNAVESTNSFCQGVDNYIYGDNNFQQGLLNVSYLGYGNFMQGESNYAQGSTGDYVYYSCMNGRDNNARYSSYSFLQGYANRTAGDRCFTQGYKAYANHDDQKTWGSNRNVLGGAQSSRLIKHVQTTTGSAVTIANISLQGNSANGFTALITGRNTTTIADNVVYTLDRALAFRDTGSATLNGTPTFTQEATGGATATAASMIVSGGNNIFIQVTGVAGQTYEWILDLHFLEVTN